MYLLEEAIRLVAIPTHCTVIGYLRYLQFSRGVLVQWSCLIYSRSLHIFSKAVCLPTYAQADLSLA